MNRSNDPAFSKHEIRIYEDITVNALWHWSVDDPDVVDRYSRKLGALVAKDRTEPSPRPRSRVSPGDRVTESALKSIISSIPGTSDDLPPVLATSSPDYGFSQLLELAIGCWEYECALHENFRKFAKEVREKWQTFYPEEFKEGSSRIPRQRPIDWMFVALVFEWQDIFQDKSAHVVVKFDPRSGMDLERYKGLPEDFRELVTETRREMVLNTYNQIRDSWLSLYDPENRNSSSMGIIFSHFIGDRLDLDLRKPAPNGLHEQVDANNLLGELETIIGGSVDTPIRRQDVQPQPVKRLDAVSVSHEARRHGRNGGFGLTARNTFKLTVEASRKTFRSNPNWKLGGSTSSDQSSEHTEMSKETQWTLEAKLNNWRTKNLSGVPFADSRFSELRGRRIQQTTSELDTNGRAR